LSTDTRRTLAVTGSAIGIVWTAFRALINLLHRRPERTEQAIMTPPSRTDDRRFDALLAAFAEMLADRPRWTASVPRLDEPWEATGTPRMRDEGERRVCEIDRVADMNAHDDDGNGWAMRASIPRPLRCER